MKTNEDKKGKGGRSVQKTLLFSLLIFCGLAIIGIGSAAAAPSVSVSPASTTDLSPGGTFSINVLVDSLTYNLRACTLDLTYDSTALSVVSVTSGDLLGTAVLQSPDTDTTDDGSIRYGIARTGVNPSVPVSGAFITVNFAVKSGAADATYTLDLCEVTLKDENNDAIPGVVVTDGTATVEVGEKGDFDGDGDVDFDDFVDFAAAYGATTCADANYDAIADFDDDCNVDFDDFVDFAGEYTG